jgi:hypothetical protein
MSEAEKSSDKRRINSSPVKWGRIRNDTLSLSNYKSFIAAIRLRALALQGL